MEGVGGREGDSLRFTEKVKAYGLCKYKREVEERRVLGRCAVYGIVSNNVSKRTVQKLRHTFPG